MKKYCRISGEVLLLHYLISTDLVEYESEYIRITF